MEYATYNLFNLLAGTPPNPRFRLDIFRHHSSCRHNGSVANRYSTDNGGVSPYPATVTDDDGLCGRAPTVFARSRIPVWCQAFGKRCRMRGGVHLDTRSDEHIIADYNRVAVVENATIVDADIIAHMDVIAKTDDCAIAHRNIRADTAEQFAYHAIPF